MYNIIDKTVLSHDFWNWKDHRLYDKADKDYSLRVFYVQIRNYDLLCVWLYLCHDSKWQNFIYPAGKRRAASKSVDGFPHSGSCFVWIAKPLKVAFAFVVALDAFAIALCININGPLLASGVSSGAGSQRAGCERLERNVHQRTGCERWERNVHPEDEWWRRCSYRRRNMFVISSHKTSPTWRHVMSHVLPHWTMLCKNTFTSYLVYYGIFCNYIRTLLTQSLL